MTTPKERPIIFSADMVRAILDGRKTQTRRTVKTQPPFGCEYVINSAGSAACCFATGANPIVWVPPTAKSVNHLLPCPYGCPGDRLWVRETWKTGSNIDHLSPKLIREKFEDTGYRPGDRANGKCCPMFYVADDKHLRWGGHDVQDFGDWGKTRVSIHMPRWASRITLEVTDVRVERLTSISESDCKAEGVEATAYGRDPDAFDERYGTPEGLGRSHKLDFKLLWNRIYGDVAWAANPWVWVVEFERVSS